MGLSSDEVRKIALKMNLPLEGRIPYQKNRAYWETAFQWNGLCLYFDKQLDEFKGEARAVCYFYNGTMGSYSCKGVDSWGYHEGKAWHFEKITWRDLQKISSQIKNVKDVVWQEQLENCLSTEPLSQKDFVTLTAKVWRTRVMENLKKFVAYEEVNKI